MLFRFDRGSLRSPRRLDDGRMIVDGRLTRTGVFTYTNQDGTTRREYRPPEEVFHKDSLESFQMVPITDDHPLAGRVTIENSKELAVGWTGENVRRDGDFMASPLMFADVATISKLEAGKLELSCGYALEIDETPGITPEGERYDVVQRKIRGNHVALVDVGRAGPLARIRMDSADSAAAMLETSATQRNDAMDPELLKALEAKASLQVRLDAAEAQVKALETRATEAESRATKAEAERDGEKVRADKAESLRTDGAELSRLVQARAALEQSAAAMIGGEYKCDGKSDLELRCDALKAREEFAFDKEKHSAEYVQIRFDSAVRYFKAEDDPYRGLVKADPEAVKTREDASEMSAYQRMIDRNANACKAAQE